VLLPLLDLLRAVSKFVETVHWKEALKILKLAVTRSSTLVAPPSSSSSSLSGVGGGHHAAAAASSHLWEAHTSFAEAEVYFKKGRRGHIDEQFPEASTAFFATFPFLSDPGVSDISVDFLKLSPYTP
jgi:hypothetical protein